MAEVTKKDDADQRRDAILKRMLETPPKPHKPITKKTGSKKPSAK